MRTVQTTIRMNRADCPKAFLLLEEMFGQEIEFLVIDPLREDYPNIRDIRFLYQLNAERENKWSRRTYYSSYEFLKKIDMLQSVLPVLQNIQVEDK